MYFRAVDHAGRVESFRVLPFVAGRLTSAWGTQVGSTARLLADGVLEPYLAAEAKIRRLGDKHALRILDVGSAEGMLTSGILARLVTTGAVGDKKLDISLVDIFHGNPARHFKSPWLRPKIGKIEYISADYFEWLDKGNVPGRRRFDFALMSRVVNHRRHCSIGFEQTPCGGNNLAPMHKQIHPHMSDYYYLLSRLLKGRNSERKAASEGIFYPRCTIRPSALLTRSGRSIFEALLDISKVIVINGLDPSPQELTEHLRKYCGPNIAAYDLSPSLRLSTNHVYCISKAHGICPVGEADRIWPRS